MDEFIYAPPPPPPLPSLVKSEEVPVENTSEQVKPKDKLTTNPNQNQNQNQNQKNKKRPLDNDGNKKPNNNNSNNRKKKHKTATNNAEQGVGLAHGNKNTTSSGKVNDEQNDGNGDNEDISDDNDDFSDDEAKLTTIPGTNIVLQTEEDIAKWIEERKKNWPSEKRIEEKAKELAERQKVLNGASGLNSGDKYGNANNKSNNSRPGNQGNKRICKFFAKNGKCRNGDNCKFLHEQGTSNNSSGNTNSRSQGSELTKKFPNHKTVVLHGVPIQVPLRFKPSLNKGKSLHNLVAESEQIRSENHKLLDLFDAIVNSDLIDTNWDVLKAQLHLT